MGFKVSKQKILIWICAAVFLTGIAGSIAVLMFPHGTQIEIIQDGTVLYTFDLAETQNQVLEIEYDGKRLQKTMEALNALLREEVFERFEACGHDEEFRYD